MVIVPSTYNRFTFHREVAAFVFRHGSTVHVVNGPVTVWVGRKGVTVKGREATFRHLDRSKFRIIGAVFPDGSIVKGSPYMV